MSDRSVAAVSLLPLVKRGRWGAVDLNMSLSIEEALFEMIDGTLGFMWAFRDPQADSPRMPGPVNTVVSGQRVQIAVTNTLDEPHGFSVLGVPETQHIRGLGGTDATGGADPPRPHRQ
jgi:hypothetical protein